MSQPLTDAQLLAWLSGALEPGRARQVARLVEATPTLRDRARRLAEGLELANPTSPWRIPPPGVRGGREPLQARPEAADVLGDDRVRPGDRFQVHLGPVTRPAERCLVVLYHRDGWQVVFPTSAEDLVSPEVLDREPDGSWVLDLAARDERGPQRWAVALPLRGLLSEDLMDWTRVMAGVTAGDVPVASVEVDVT